MRLSSRGERLLRATISWGVAGGTRADDLDGALELALALFPLTPYNIGAFTNEIVPKYG